MIDEDFIGPTFTVIPREKSDRIVRELISDKTPLELTGEQLHGIYVLLRQERRRDRMIPRDDVALDACITVVGEALARSGFLERRDQRIKENLARYLGLK